MIEILLKMSVVISLIHLDNLIHKVAVNLNDRAVFRQLY